MSKKVIFAAATTVFTTSAIGFTGISYAGPADADQPAPSRTTAVQRATAAADTHRSALQATSADQFSARDVIVDPDGSTHVRMNRSIGGLPVLGGDTVVHSDARGQWKGASLTLQQPVTISRTPRLAAGDAARMSPALREASSPQLVIEARQGAPRLAYLFTVTGTQDDGTPSRVVTSVDANTGARLLSEEQIQTAEGKGKSLYRGTVPVYSRSVEGDTAATAGRYELTDTKRGNAKTYDVKNGEDGALCQVFGVGCASGPIFTDADNVWGNGKTSDRASAAVDVQYGTAATWDYFKSAHGRTGIFNDGKGVPSRVHYGDNYVNAFWDGKQMTYGDGDNKAAGPLVSIDVAGHEMSHGVMSATADLTYSGESGGLNEASSDIFGALIENKNSTAADPGDWFVGEEIVKDRPALRYMDKPSKDGTSADCYSSDVGTLDVHYSSGVANHFAYLLANGSGAKTINGIKHSSPTCNGKKVTGIGNTKLGKIWYRAISVYMTSSTDYAGARKATLDAAEDLYGSGSAEYKATAAAWSAVKVG